MSTNNRNHEQKDTPVKSRDALDASRHNDEISTLIDIGKALTSHLSLDAVYQVVMEKISELLQPQAWSLLTVDEQTRELSFEIVVSSAVGQLQGTRLQPGEGIAGWVAENGTPLLVPDVNQDPRFARHIDERIGFVTRSIVCVPLIVNQQTIGVIQLLNSADKGEFSPQDQQILAVIADFTAIAIENSRLMARIHSLTITDPLTSLYNSEHFQTLCEYELERAKRLNTELSLIFLDLDHFKQVNDTHGHLTGSRVIRESGHLFQRVIRKMDYAARYGGDEFVFLLPSTSKNGALALAEKLLSSLRQTPFYADSGQPVQITGSLGIATYPTNACSLKDLVKQADEAMYRVKHSTRNGVESA
jgi:diguanylate cyclase (GGDEF)-like protein